MDGMMYFIPNVSIYIIRYRSNVPDIYYKLLVVRKDLESKRPFHTGATWSGEAQGARQAGEEREDLFGLHVALQSYGQKPISVVDYFAAS